MTDEFYTDTELAARGFSAAFLNGEIAARRLRAVRQGTGFAVRRSDFGAWFDKFYPGGKPATASAPAQTSRASVPTDGAFADGMLP